MSSTYPATVSFMSHQHTQSKLPHAIVAETVPASPKFELDLANTSQNAQLGSAKCYRDLLHELSIEEKVSLLSGSSFTETTGAPRLRIPHLKVSDSINGVRGSQSHLEDRGTACFPSTTCLASTWNTELMYQFGHEVGIQAKLKAVQVVIGPNINLHRDPRGGRNFETFSEDPVLTGKMAASIVNGMQSTGVGACAKHFVGNESETKRRKYDVSTSANSRTMRELYMRAFQLMLRDSNPVSIMMAYNKIEGQYCSQTPLIQSVLKDSWKYDGCIMSDWYGTRAGAQSLRAGLDLEMPGPSVFRGKKLIDELAEGSVIQADIDRAACSVLTMVDRTVNSHSEAAEQVIVCERTSSMARQLAAEGIVLLRNEQSVLPLDMGKAGRIAVIGSPATIPIISGGGSACAQPQYSKSFLACLKEEHPCPAFVRYARGLNPHHCVPALPLELLTSSDGAAGIHIDYYNDGCANPIYSEDLNTSQVVMLGRLKPGLQQQDFHYIITATLVVPTTGKHTLGAQITGDFTFDLDGSNILKGAAPDITVEDFLFVPKRLERTTKVNLEAKRQYRIRLLVHSRKSANNGEPTPHAAKLVFQEAFDNRQSIAEAVTLAARSDTSIIFAGRTYENESEGFDLDNIDLDTNQVRLIKAVSAVSERTVLVLHHGNPIDLSPIMDDVEAIIAAHFPGQEGASALTDIIIGRTNPSGRLATTWPLRLDKTCVPSHENFPCTDSAQPSISYNEGLQLGYRHPSASTTARFLFGHGLSYSVFKTADLRVCLAPEEDERSYKQRRLTASLSVWNAGPYPGKHVVQLYVEAPQQTPPSPELEKGTVDPVSTTISGCMTQVWRPKRELVSFAKLYLAPGETEVVHLSFLLRDVTSTWDEDINCWRARGGRYEFVVADGTADHGSSRAELDLSGNGQLWNGL